MRPLRVGLVCPYSLDVPGGVQNHVRDLAAILTTRGHTVQVLAPGALGPDLPGYFRSAGKAVPGGVQNHVRDLAAILATRGHTVQVLAPGALGPDLPGYFRSAGKAVPVRFNGSVARVAFGPRAVSRVRHWLGEGGFDVLHVHEPSAPSISLIALWASDLPVVGTFHTTMPRSRAMSSTVSLLRPAMEKISARIAVSEAARATLVQHVGGEPVVISNGLTCAPFAAAQPRPEWTTPGPTIVFLGRMDEPRKGLAVVMEAFPSVLAQHPTARLLVAGSGDAQAWSEGAGPGRSGIEFLGQVSNDDRARLLSSATVFVAPQIGGESFGIVLVEAMAAGAPVVASALPGFRAVLEGGLLGDLFDVGDSADLARVLNALLSDPDRRTAMAARAAAAVTRYDWSQLVGDIESVYAAVVAMASAGGT